MSYRIEGLVDDRLTFEAGSNLLLTGSSPLVTERLYDALEDGIADGEAIIVISTDAGAETVSAEFERRDAFAGERIGVIDTTGEGTDEGDLAVRDLGSPGDLTGMSLEFAKLSEQLAPAGDDGRLRIGVATVSTLLMYADVRTVFRFLHVFTSRIRSAEMFGVFAMDPEMHDDQTTSTVRAVFNAEARVSDGGVELRGSGFERE
jgi:hypothetical protein